MAVIYSIGLGTRFFKWRILSLSWPNALLFLQLLIARSAVNVCVISNGFLLTRETKLVCLVERPGYVVKVRPDPGMS